MEESKLAATMWLAGKKEAPEYTTIKIWSETRHNLRLLAAVKGTSMVEIMDMIVTAELKSSAKKREVKKNGCKGGKVSGEQKKWLDSFKSLPYSNSYVARGI